MVSPQTGVLSAGRAARNEASTNAATLPDLTLLALQALTTLGTIWQNAAALRWSREELQAGAAMRLRLGHVGSMARGSSSAERVQDPLVRAQRRIASLESVRDDLQQENDILAAR